MTKCLVKCLDNVLTILELTYFWEIWGYHS